MVDILYRVITWGLLGVFGVFLAYGVANATYTLLRFYLAEFTKLGRNRLATPQDRLAGSPSASAPLSDQNCLD